MPLFARIVYASLLWQERRRAKSGVASGAKLRKAVSTTAPHLETGRRGETLAYWYLRREGYTMVARNLRLRPEVGELDLVGWDGPVLAFIEVKTRTSLEAGLPEEAISENQQKRIARAAQVYLRRLKRKELNYRFDVVSVIWDEHKGFRLRLIRDAFRPGGSR